MNIKDVENLAELARIELTAEEKQNLLSDMDSILGYVKQIEEVSVENIEPEYAVHNVWREDSPRLAEVGQVNQPEFSKELITMQFPDSQPARPDGRSGGDGIFLKVKKIL